MGDFVTMDFGYLWFIFQIYFLLLEINFKPSIRTQFTLSKS
jgi:hypothetical protein